MIKAASITVAVLAVVAFSGLILRQTFMGLDGWEQYRPLSATPTALDVAVSRDFLADPTPTPATYDRLFQYFLGGFVANGSNELSLVHYPGLAGAAGYTVNGLEGFARTAPLLAAWIYSGRPRVVTEDITGRAIDLVDVVQDGILAGTDPTSSGYWGKIAANSQRIIEASDVARTLWLTRDYIWLRLDERAQRQIATWLLQVDTVEISRRNNWILTPVVVTSFLKSVGYISDPDYRNYFEFKRNYVDNGWYRDGPGGRIDYYNAWGISYDLFWVHLFDPDLDTTFIGASLVESGRLTAHLISPKGIPMFGRSICYRPAVPSPVLAASIMAPKEVDPSLARRALDVTWRYFIGHRLLRDGTITMGYWETDARLVDNYSGPGSCHWGLRSLVLAYMTDPGGAFWTDEPKPLPVEQQSYKLALSSFDWVVIGDVTTSDIAITMLGNRSVTIAPEPYGVLDLILEIVRRRNMRPSNEPLKYDLRTYSAIVPFGGALSK